MKITRRFTKDGQNPFETTRWTTRSSRINNPDGSVVFEMDDAEVPESWSQLATDIMVSKYFRKAGVPQLDAQGKPTVDANGRTVTGPERSARQVIGRLAGCWRHWGERHNYFDSAEDAQAFHDEIVYMLVHQMAAPNSPQWFNTGLHWAYGITGPAQGHSIVDAASGEVLLAPDAYTHPQPHACFIQSVTDDLVGPGGIMDLWVREARLFKYGSGTGTNFSELRAEDESLSGGGKSSGLMSWLKIGDRAAGAIKSGGTTRRAAKMVCLDLDHPDIEQFINWKVREEIKVAAMVEGVKHLGEGLGEGGSAAGVTMQEAARDLGLTLDYDFNGEAYATVSGQNSNNSVRIPDAFFEAVDADGEWALTYRTTGEVARTLSARALWDQVGFAAWRCADPGVQYDSTINAWHTCPNSGRINASNPCSEYMFLDNTACNLASLNLLTFYNAKTREFDLERFEHATDLWTIVLEISVLMAAFPSAEVAQRSYDFRTLGLGYANIGAMLMQAGIPYDSDDARAVCAMLTSILTGRSYRMSAQMAQEHSPFPGFTQNREAMLRVIRNHRRAAQGVQRNADEWEDLRIRPVSIDHAIVRDRETNGAFPIINAGDMLDRAHTVWDDALALGVKHGFRNAQVTVIAPTGTIGLLMDCDTTGVEPDFALVKFKKLAGGGYFKIANHSLRPALETLGYRDEHIRDILTYVLGTLALDVPMPSKKKSKRSRNAASQTFAQWLIEKGLNVEDLRTITDALPGVFDIASAFGTWTLGDEALTRLGINADKAKATPSFDLLATLGLSQYQRECLNETICGTQTIEGAPHLREEHLPVFDCASTCGRIGTRCIAADGHIRMMAAAQPFISGAISKTINLPNTATVDDIKSAYHLSWELGLKANALYRDGCKLSQPLNTSSKEDTTDGEGAVSEADGFPAEGDRGVRMLMDVIAEGDEPEGLKAAQEEVAHEVAGAAVSISAGDAHQAVRTIERIVHRPMRRRLPDTRRSITHKFNVAGHEGYLTVGLYDDGQPGELFITMAKEGSTIGGLMDSLGTCTSVALQYGVPIDSLVKKFTHQRFEPAGMTANPDIPIAKSLVDYIFRWLGIQFIDGYREATVPKRPSSDAAREPSDGSSPSAWESVGTASVMAAGSGQIAASVVASQRGAQAQGQHADPRTLIATATQADRQSAVHGEATYRREVITASVQHSSADAITRISRHTTRSGAGSGLSAALQDCQEDAPACDVCGTITVRNGTCYKCLNCGHSMGCS